MCGAHDISGIECETMQATLDFGENSTNIFESPGSTFANSQIIIIASASAGLLLFIFVLVVYRKRRHSLTANRPMKKEYCYDIARQKQLERGIEGPDIGRKQLSLEKPLLLYRLICN